MATATTLNELYVVVVRLINDGEGHRTLLFDDSDEPEIWAVTTEVAESIPAMLYVATVDTYAN